MFASGLGSSYISLSQPLADPGGGGKVREGKDHPRGGTHTHTP